MLSKEALDQDNRSDFLSFHRGGDGSSPHVGPRASNCGGRAVNACQGKDRCANRLARREIFRQKFLRGVNKFSNRIDF